MYRQSYLCLYFINVSFYFGYFDLFFEYFFKKINRKINKIYIIYSLCFLNKKKCLFKIEIY